MLCAMALLSTATDLTDAAVDAAADALARRGDPGAQVLGRVFNQVVDRSQKGIDHARGGLEADAITQHFFADLSASMTAAHGGAVDMAMGLSGPAVAETNLLLCLQNTVAPPPPPGAHLKRMSILRKRPDVSPEAFQEQWFELHALLVRRLAGLSGYRQSLVLDGPRDETGALLADGMVELWFPDAAAIEAAFRSDVGTTTMTHAREFIAEISTWLVRPVTVSGVS
ncbi:EthD family reductase [Rhodovulum sp. DZ06]|uniref:EthD family reductase n=1 Tax=Rhodovulum sp. DZ06 TaxID=3425126 RepID=UPI003D352521